MLVSVCSSETIVLEWVPHLVQLICCGAVDRQPDNRSIILYNVMITVFSVLLK